jgi:hypothetical protein
MRLFAKEAKVAKARKPTPAHASRACHDMHSKNKRLRQEAAEVLALEPRRAKPKPKKKR